MNIELERKKLEVLQVSTSMASMKFTIMERLQDIERIKINIENQEKRLQELDTIIKEMEKK